jgi:hypothetical protein
MSTGVKHSALSVQKYTYRLSGKSSRLSSRRLTKEFKKKNAHVYRFSNSHLATFVAPAQDVYPNPAWKVSVVWCGWRLLGFALRDVVVFVSPAFAG